MQLVKTTIIIVSACIAHAAQAEMYKCTANGKISYQARPCSGAPDDPNTLKIKTMTPEQREKAAQALSRVQADYAAGQQRQAEAQAKQFEKDLRISEVEAAQRNAAAQDQQSLELRRQAEAMERQIIMPVPVFVPGGSHP